MKEFKSGNKYRGFASPEVAKLNKWTELLSAESVYVTQDNKQRVSGVAVKGTLLLSDRPSNKHQNIDGEWVKIEAKPAAGPLEALTLRVDELEKQLKSNNGKAK